VTSLFALLFDQGDRNNILFIFTRKKKNIAEKVMINPFCKKKEYFWLWNCWYYLTSINRSVLREGTGWKTYDELLGHVELVLSMPVVRWFHWLYKTKSHISVYKCQSSAEAETNTEQILSVFVTRAPERYKTPKWAGKAEGV